MASIASFDLFEFHLKAQQHLIIDTADETRNERRAIGRMGTTTSVIPHHYDSDVSIRHDEKETPNPIVTPFMSCIPLGFSSVLFSSPVMFFFFHFNFFVMKLFFSLTDTAIPIDSVNSFFTFLLSYSLSPSLRAYQLLFLSALKQSFPLSSLRAKFSASHAVWFFQSNATSIDIYNSSPSKSIYVSFFTTLLEPRLPPNCLAHLNRIELN